VNYYAGIHAMCRYGDANVHHVLPIAGGEIEKAKQNFVHRLQSALLDVSCTSGKVFARKASYALFLPKGSHSISMAFKRCDPCSVVLRGIPCELSSVHSPTRRHGRHQCPIRVSEKKSTRETQWMPLSQGFAGWGASALSIATSNGSGFPRLNRFVFG